MGEAVGVDVSVTVGNDFKSQFINPRHAGHRSIGQTRQFGTVTFGQMVFCDLDLFFNQIKIVQEPFSRGCNPAFCPDC